MILFCDALMMLIQLQSYVFMKYLGGEYILIQIRSQPIYHTYGAEILIQFLISSPQVAWCQCA